MGQWVGRAPRLSAGGAIIGPLNHTGEMCMFCTPLAELLSISPDNKFSPSPLNCFLR